MENLSINKLSCLVLSCLDLTLLEEFIEFWARTVANSFLVMLSKTQRHR